METDKGHADPPDTGYFSTESMILYQGHSLGSKSITLAQDQIIASDPTALTPCPSPGVDSLSGEFERQGCPVTFNLRPFSSLATPGEKNPDVDGEECVDGELTRLSDTLADKVKFQEPLILKDNQYTKQQLNPSVESKPEPRIDPEEPRIDPDQTSDSQLDQSDGDYDADDDVTDSDDDVTLVDQDEDGDTLLHLSIICMLQDIFYRILRQATPAQLKVILHTQNDLQQTPLLLGVLTAQARVVRILTVLGSPRMSRDRLGNTPLHLAARTGDTKSVRALTSQVTDKERIKIKSLLEKEGMRELTQCDPEVFNYEGDTCLHVAASQGHLHVVKYLLDHVGCDVNQGDGKSGRTILHHAVERGDVRLLTFLLMNRRQYGLDLDAQTYEGHTALKLAYSRDLATLTSNLVLMGADANLIQSDDEDCAT